MLKCTTKGLRRACKRVGQGRDGTAKANAEDQLSGRMRPKGSTAHQLHIHQMSYQCSRSPLHICSLVLNQPVADQLSQLS